MIKKAFIIFAAVVVVGQGLVIRYGGSWLIDFMTNVRLVPKSHAALILIVASSFVILTSVTLISLAGFVFREVSKPK